MHNRFAAPIRLMTTAFPTEEFDPRTEWLGFAAALAVLCLAVAALGLMIG